MIESLLPKTRGFWTMNGRPVTINDFQKLEKAREEVARLYGNRLRVRVCGICIENNQILMVSHRGIGKTDTFWCPPGGGLQFEETIQNALRREFEEETGLEIEVKKLLFVNEFMAPPLHALELFFEVSITGGRLHLGIDPEMTEANQIIQEVCWMSFDDIKKYPISEVHSMFKYCDSLEDIYHLQGYLGAYADSRNDKNKTQTVYS